MTAATRLSEPACEKQDDDDDQDDAEGTDPTVTVAAETPTEATEQKNDEDDNESDMTKSFCEISELGGATSRVLVCRLWRSLHEGDPISGG